MADPFSNFAAGLDSPARNAAAVSGVGALAATCRALYVGTGGTLVVTMQAGGDVTFANVADGSFLPISVSAIVTGTTASGIVALW